MRKRWTAANAMSLGCATPGGALLTALILAALLGPHFLPHSPHETDFMHILESPSRQHWFGTDELGRDLLSRTLYGARTSLLIAVDVQLAGTCVGVMVGLIAGYSRRTIDAPLMALMDAVYAFPALIIVIVIVAVLPPGIPSIVLALSCVSWPLPARVVRGKVASLRNETFVLAARATGASNARVLILHILPNAMGPIVALLAQGAAGAIMAEAALSFLGIGVPASQPSWGGMIAAGRDSFLSSPHVTLFPALALITTIACLNFLGNTLRIYLDPRLKAHLRRVRFSPKTSAQLIVEGRGLANRSEADRSKDVGSET